MCVRHDALLDFCLCLFVVVQLRCLWRCVMKFACWTIARLEVRSQCVQMVLDVSGFLIRWTGLESPPAWWCNVSMIVYRKFFAGIPSICNPAANKKNPSFSAAVEYSYLFLTSPWIWHKRMRSQHAQNAPWCWFWVSEISCKIGVLE